MEFSGRCCGKYCRPDDRQDISVEALADLLQNAGAAAESCGNGAALPGLDSDWPGQVWQIFIHSEQGSRSFAVTSPLSAPPPRQFN